MRIQILACRVLTRELSALVPQCKNNIDITWLPKGLHDTPVILNNFINEQLEAMYDLIHRKIQRRVPDYICLGYGLCSKAIVGLEAKEIPLVIPRVEDCIALFLGSQDRYLEYFKKYQGTLWLNSRWVEDTPDIDEDYDDKLRAQYMEEYDEDEDTVDYLMEMHRDHLANYENVGYISTDTFDERAQKAVAQSYAKRYQLNFLDFEGDNSILRKMVNGDFDEKNFLIVPPGYQVEYTNGTERIIAVKSRD